MHFFFNFFYYLANYGAKTLTRLENIETKKRPRLRIYQRKITAKIKFAPLSKESLNNFLCCFASNLELFSKKHGDLAPPLAKTHSRTECEGGTVDTLHIYSPAAQALKDTACQRKHQLGAPANALWRQSGPLCFAAGFTFTPWQPAECGTV